MLGHLPTDGNEALFQQPQEFGDLAGFLAAFGLALRPAVHERIDHVSCECGFLAFLACKEACALDVDPLDCDHRQEDVPMWEMKTGTVGSGVNLLDHDVQ